MPAGASVKKNVLLVKAEVGKARPTVYDLPETNHIYGKQIARDPDNCASTGRSFIYKRMSRDIIGGQDHVKNLPHFSPPSSSALECQGQIKECHTFS
jgi:hypothetical protein